MEDRGPYIRIWQELSRDKSMIFLAGPRQVGKTFPLVYTFFEFRKVHDTYSPPYSFAPLRNLRILSKYDILRTN